MFSTRKGLTWRDVSKTSQVKAIWIYSRQFQCSFKPFHMSCTRVVVFSSVPLLSSKLCTCVVVILVGVRLWMWQDLIGHRPYWDWLCLYVVQEWVRFGNGCVYVCACMWTHLHFIEVGVTLASHCDSSRGGSERVKEGQITNAVHLLCHNLPPQRHGTIPSHVRARPCSANYLLCVYVYTTHTRIRTHKASPN